MKCKAGNNTLGGSPSNYNGEISLAAAMMLRAFEDLKINGEFTLARVSGIDRYHDWKVTRAIKESIRESAYQWIMNDERSDLSFLNCCEALDLNAVEARARAVRIYREQQH